MIEMRKIFDKLHTKIGASLLEMMVTVLLLGIMGAALTYGVSTVNNTHNKIVRKANEQTLLSTTLIEMRNWIRYSTEYYVSGSRVLFHSDKGYWIEFVNNNDKGICVSAYSDFKNTEPNETFALVSEYDGKISGIHSELGSISVENGRFNINDLIVKGDDDNEPTRLGETPNEYVVAPLKPITEVQE